jgi:hypothetical protein
LTWELQPGYREKQITTHSEQGVSVKCVPANPSQ